tara:strand:- start:7342 stop:7992 length:651 start_codon:yes stop_codon:yes gene_type:complete
MKIAVCFSGQIRSFNLVKDSMKKFLLNDPNIDVFCHTYYRYDNSDYVNFTDPHTPIYGNFGDINLNELIDLFKPKSFKFEPPNYPENAKSMFNSIYESNELKKQYEEANDFKYDIVVRGRYDLLFNTSIDYVIDNNIHLIERPGGRGGINDWYAYGNSHNMDIYSSVFPCYKHTEKVKEIGPEKLLGEHVYNNGISVVFLDRDSFCLQRRDGSTLA